MWNYSISKKFLNASIEAFPFLTYITWNSDKRQYNSNAYKLGVLP